MSCTSVRNSSPYYNCSMKLSKRYTPSIVYTKLNVGVKNGVLFSFRSLKCIQYYGSDSNSLTRMLSQKPRSTVSRRIATETPSMMPELVADKLKRLVCEFKSLKEPIDRVKRLLHYAMLLAPMDESARMSENRVTGCTTQVWLEVKIDECGRMRFKADSDSEITKGFCSCLIWMLDGAEPTEVLAVKMEDLEAVNLGLQGKAQSRVNTWQNVLISMQKRTSTLFTVWVQRESAQLLI